MTIPEAFKNTDSSKTRTYYVLRNHDGVVDVLDGALSSDGLSYTFTTDRFSDYVLTYKDTTKTADTVTTPETSGATTTAAVTTATTTSSPKTGERMPIAWMFVLLLCGAAGMYGCSEVLFRKKR